MKLASLLAGAVTALMAAAPLSAESLLLGPGPTSDSARLVGDVTSAPAAPGTRAAAPFLGYITAHHAHVSGNEASGHTSWDLKSGTSRKMEVQSTLKAKTSWFGYSTMSTSGKVSVWPGGGRGKAAVAKKRCNGTKKTAWYTYGEGFAPGAQKPWGSHKGEVQNLYCGA